SCRLATIFVIGFVVGLAHCSNPWTPEPRSENWWQDRNKLLINVTKHHTASGKLLFHGDSITEGWGINGKESWEKHYATRNGYNYGVSGDRTEQILWRMEQGQFDHVNPDLVVLMIGELDIVGWID